MANRPDEAVFICLDGLPIQGGSIKKFHYRLADSRYTLTAHPGMFYTMLRQTGCDATGIS